MAPQKFITLSEFIKVVRFRNDAAWRHERNQVHFIIALRCVKCTWENYIDGGFVEVSCDYIKYSVQFMNS